MRRPDPLTRPTLFWLGGSALALAWLAPLEPLVPGPFSRFMLMHVGVVAVAAPLIALGIAGGRLDPIRAMSTGGAAGLTAACLGLLFAPLTASVIELLVVWGWHAPALHEAARSSPLVLGIEQTSFLLAGLLVWLSAFGGEDSPRSRRRGEGVVALLLTSMHMTLLGALLALPPRPLYAAGSAASSLADQHLGGALMIGVGGVAYLAGGLALTLGLLRGPGREPEAPDPAATAPMREGGR